MKTHKKLILLSLILISLLSIFLLKSIRGGEYLYIKDNDTGKIYSKYKVEEGDEFSVGFIHSVNKSPLIDVYRIHDGKIYVDRTIYYSFGAGVQTELENDEKLVIDDGAMIVSGFNREIPNLSYFVGTVSDHTLCIDNKSVSLRDLCGRNANIKFSCENK